MFCLSCNDKPAGKTATINPSYHGSVKISADESFRPVLEQQRMVFESTYPNAKLNISYKPEAACLKDLESDSTVMVLVARSLSDPEEAAYRNRLGYPPRSGKLAFDAVTMVLNENSKDSLYSWARLQDVISGRENVQAAVDGSTATSVVRMLIDTVNGGKAPGNNVRSADSSEGVLLFVAGNPGSIGFVGSSWVEALSSSGAAGLPRGVKLAKLECRRCDEKGYYAAPVPKNIYTRGYPLVRTLYYILKENNPAVGTTFVNFLSQERGQLIFRRARLVPAQMLFQKRNIEL